MRIQLWSYNYDPEPTGIGPVSRVFAEGLQERGHAVEVVAAHPHYPTPRWGNRLLPYRERRSGVPVLRLPLWIGRDSPMTRYRQDLSFTVAQTLTAPWLPEADINVSVSPCFPALIPAVLNARARRVPWVLWLHDILPDGAVSSGLAAEGNPAIRLARYCEQWAYRNADRIVVLSEAFTENLVEKGVPRAKITLIYPPATREPGGLRVAAEKPRILSMGNIGHSQGLAGIVAAFERSSDLAELAPRFVITGHGVEEGAVRSEIRSCLVEMCGMVDDTRLEAELLTATVGLVSQRHAGAEFNIPSKLMNFMAYGLPIVAVVDPEGEVARIVRQSRAGWVINSGELDGFGPTLAKILVSQDELARCGRAAKDFARRNFLVPGIARRFEHLFDELVVA